MAHMPTSAQPDSVPTVGGLVVTYTATGTEGTSFLVPIGITVNSSDYEIIWSARGVSSVVPVIDLPDAVGDRTTTYFRVNCADVLTAGDQLTFVLFGA
jgi:hypothetical protein